MFLSSQLSILAIPILIVSTVEGFVENTTIGKYAFIDRLLNNMTVSELALQLHMMFSDNVIGPDSDNSLYDYAMQIDPKANFGVLHDFYPTNKSQYNDLQKLNIKKSRLGIPFMQFGECLHGVGSYKGSIFPQSLGMAASFDTDLVYKVGRAIGSEARSIGIHACLSPVLDLALEPRWGRIQEAWGEDMLLTSMMGVFMASGLSKNGSWADSDAVAPVMKHFAAHGSPQGGINGAPSMILGSRQVIMNMLRPFKAVVDLGGVRGTLMAYSELDSIPSHVHPMLYQALEDWGFNGFVTSDDAGMIMLQEGHAVSSSPADTIAQWLNAGGMIQYYDFPIATFVNSIIDLVQNGTVGLSTLQAHVRSILDVKYDLGLFTNPYIHDTLEPSALTAKHAALTLNAAQKSIVLLENRNKALPLKLDERQISKIALIGPFGDTMNYGDYSGTFGSNPATYASTIRQAMIQYLVENAPSVKLVSSFGANTWEYNAQYNIPNYLLKVNGTAGGLMATYFADTNYTRAVLQQSEAPNRDWGLYPPNGLPSNNFSVIWEGEIASPVDHIVNGYIGVAVYANTTSKLYIDGKLIQISEASVAGNILSNIPGYSYTTENSTAPPPGSAPFTFTPNATHQIKIEYQAWNYNQKYENTNSINAQIQLFWNLVDRQEPIQKAANLAADADIIILAVGANWNSDGEGGDRASLNLSTNQTELADTIFALGKPVIMVLQGGRPFAIPEYYAQSAAVLDTFFPGQSGGQAISDVLFGVFNPGGRLPITIPSDIGTLPVFYNYKDTARADIYLDKTPWPSYPFGYGLSYTSFEVSSFSATSSTGNKTFGANSTIHFSIALTNNGTVAGSYVPQVYLLNRVSMITQPLKQLMAFKRVYLEVGESAKIVMDLEVDRFLPILDRKWQWTLEKGEYTFALLENSGHDVDTGVNVTLSCF